MIKMVQMIILVEKFLNCLSRQALCAQSERISRFVSSFVELHGMASLRCFCFCFCYDVTLNVLLINFSWLITFTTPNLAHSE